MHFFCKLFSFSSDSVRFTSATMIWVKKHEKYLYTPSNASKSFMYSIAEYFLLQGRVEVNPEYDGFISQHFMYENISGALKISKFQLFEKKNPTISINVHSTDNALKNFYPVYASENTTYKKAHVINILYSYAFNAPQYHLITDLSKLFSLKNIRGKQGNYTRRPAHVCPRCYYRSYSIEAYSNHRELCNLKHASEIDLVTKPIKFEAIHKTSLSPLVAFYDFECSNHPTSCLNCANECECNTKKLLEQLPITYSLYIINTLDNSIFYSKVYSGDDAAVDLLNTCLLYTSDAADE